MDDPPDVDVPAAEALLVVGEQVHVLGHQQGLLGSCGVTHGVCKEGRSRGRWGAAGRGGCGPRAAPPGQALEPTTLRLGRAGREPPPGNREPPSEWGGAVDPPTKFLQEEGLSSCFQAPGQPTSTVLCFMAPRPADWMRCDMPSRRLDDTTSWQKPLVFSVPIRARMFCRAGGREGVSRGLGADHAHPVSPTPGTGSLHVDVTASHTEAGG